MRDHENQRHDNSVTRAGSPGVVAFDFDGTLTVRDSFRAFLGWKVGALGYGLGYLRIGPAALAYLQDRDRGALKAAMIQAYLPDATRETLAADAESFAESSFAALTRPDALAAWRRHQGEGATMAIVTASPDILVAPFARRLGADRLLGTRLAFDSRGRLSGTLEGLNCRGAEKVCRLKAEFGDDLHLAAAYGDTAGDVEMLAIADRPGMKVFTARP